MYQDDKKINKVPNKCSDETPDGTNYTQNDD